MRICDMLFPPQASHQVEKEDLKKQVAEARMASEQHLKALEEARAAAASEAEVLTEKAAALAANLEAAKARHPSACMHACMQSLTACSSAVVQAAVQ